MAKSKNNKIRVTLKRSLIGVSAPYKRIVQALGISKVNQTVEHNDTAIIRGMVNKIPHLVCVE